jgi:hypothetical protein
MEKGYENILKEVAVKADKTMEVFLDSEVEKGNTKRAKADTTLKGSRNFLTEWLAPQ